MSGGYEADRRPYAEWCELFSREMGLRVIDDEGRRKCARDLGLDAPLSRAEAERYFVHNSVVRARTNSAGS